MEFLFHSVYNDGHHAKYFNVYRVENNRFLAEPHHFNFAQNIGGDFELSKKGNTWVTEKGELASEASYIGEEIDRVSK